jgi:hypothetical protein
MFNQSLIKLDLPPRINAPGTPDPPREVFSDQQYLPGKDIEIS